MTPSKGLMMGTMLLLGPRRALKCRTLSISITSLSRSSLQLQKYFMVTANKNTGRRSFSNGTALFSREADCNNFRSVVYEKKERVANITLNRPERMNAIDFHMPQEIEKAVEIANADDDVRVILLSGNGDAFCSGYDLKLYAEGKRGEMPGSQNMPWDPYIDYKLMSASTSSFMSLWRSLKPVICKIHGYAVAGGSDIALSCDICIMADDAMIGYPPARVWGCPTTAMWVYRIGVEKAKKMLFTGDLIKGSEAANIGLVCESVPFEKLTDRTNELVDRIASVPTNQLFMQKQVINSAVEQMGLFQTQRLATIFDGMTRHTPEGVEFQEAAHKHGFKMAINQRDKFGKDVS